MENVMDLVDRAVANVGRYDRTAKNKHAKFTSTLVLVGALTFTSGTAVALLYKRGIIQPLLPPPVREKVKRLTARLAEITEPPKAAQVEGFGSAKTHMRRVYSLTAATFLASFFGTRAFFAVPHIPLAIACAGAGIPALVLAFLPRRFVHRRQRLALLGAVGFGAGYVFGPVNWVAMDSMKHVAVAVFSTCAGFTISTTLTRGCVSYFVTAHCLSSSLAIIGSNLVMHGDATGPTTAEQAQDKLAFAGRVLSQAVSLVAESNGVRAPNIEGAVESVLPPPRELVATDVNVVLMLQAFGNIALAGLHSMPTILRARNKNWSLTALLAGEPQKATTRIEREGLHETEAVKKAMKEEGEAPEDAAANDNAPDEIFEALVIFSAVVYVIWTAFERACEKILSKVVRGNATVDEGNVSSVRAFLQKQKIVRRSSRFLASATFFLAYLRFVRYIQQDSDAGKKLDWARSIFRKMSPLQIVV